ncbi:MAG: adenylate kinase [Proteobacteria bacterium]|nr:adenylate kinase [Pseudomonadota bacterium]
MLVLGCAGSGKSTLSQQLAELIGVPAICLDQHYWKPGWEGSDRQTWQRVTNDLAARPEWVMDGNYSSTFPTRLKRADTAIFLDVPRLTCLSRVTLRTVRNYGKVRQSMPAGCPERFDLEFFQYIWNFEKTHRPNLIDTLRHFDGATHTLTSPREVSRFLQKARAGQMNNL